MKGWRGRRRIPSKCEKGLFYKDFTGPVPTGFEANGPHLVRVRLAFRHGGLFDGAIDDAAHDVAVLLVHSQAYTDPFRP